MTNDNQPDNEDVDRERTSPQNAFDKAGGYSGQDYHRDDEAKQGRADAENDLLHGRSVPAEGAPASPEDFGAP